MLFPMEPFLLCTKALVNRRFVRGCRPVRGGHSVAIIAGCWIVWIAAAAGWAEEADRGTLPDPIRTNRPVFTIPFRLEESKSPGDGPQRVILSMSRDLGATWRDVDDVVPTARQFAYRATTDGEYWFRLRAVDAEGRQRGGNGPDVRVILNAAGPRVAARVWRGPDGEVVCRFAAFDDTLDLASLTLEYRTAAEPAWQAIDAVGMLSRESPAHLVGEELWWAGDDPQGLTVRLTIRDESGNATTQQYALAARDPGVSQHDLAREIGAPPLPGSEPPPDPEPAPTQPLAGMSPPSVSFGTTSFEASAPAAPAGGVAGAESSSWLPGGVDAGWSSEGSHGPPPGGVASVLTASRPQPAMPGNGFPAANGQRSADVGPAFGLSSTTPPTDAGLAEATAGGGGPAPLYKGRPLLLSRSRRFAWDYAVEAADANRGVGGVELWSTRDGGITWQRVAIDEDRTSPINVALDHGGLHGFRLELAAAGELVQPPRSGDTPQCWVAIDETPPVVSIRSVVTSSEPTVTGEETIAVSYGCDDPLIVPRGARLQYSPNADGPWATVAEGLEATGRYLWTPDRSVPARAFLRIEAVDAAGNVGFAVTDEPVMVGGGRPTGQLGSLRPLPPPPAP